jgi:hypothetical protein
MINDVKKAGVRARPSQRFDLFWTVELFQVQDRDSFWSYGRFAQSEEGQPPHRLR